MMKVALFGAFAALAFSAVMGCGGRVYVDGEGGSGGSTGTAGTTGTSSTSSGTTSTPPPDFCGSICDQANQFGCLQGSSVSECVAGCVDVFQQYPDCEKEIYEFYGCVVANFGSGCDVWNSACDAPLDAFDACTGGTTTCGTNGCSGGNDFCSCDGECSGAVLQVDCKLDTSGAQCACLIDGELVGSCAGSSLSCDMFDSCCSAYFFGE
jgi:hypothetical protein